MPSEVSWVGSTCIIVYCACDMDFALQFLQVKVCSVQFCFSVGNLRIGSFLYCAF